MAKRPLRIRTRTDIPPNPHPLYGRDSTEYFATRGHRTGGVLISLNHPKTVYSDPEETYTQDEHGTPTLFNATYEPPEVSEMYSHHAKGIDVASTLGAVGLDSLKKFGRLPESSTNLSKYSLPVVSKVNKTLGRKDTHEKDLNNLDRSNGKNGLEMAHTKFDNVENDPRHVRENALSRGITYSKMSKEDVAQGSNLVRSMFKRPKLSKQFDQLELPQ